MKQHNKKHNKQSPKLWRYRCKKCGNQDETVERAYDRPLNVKLCPKCGHTMTPKEATINLSKGLKGIIKIKL